MVNAQNWLDKHYPKHTRENITELNINNKNLEDDLDLTDFVNLEKLDCSDNRLTNLNFSGLNCETVTELSMVNNDFPHQGLSYFTRFKNLKKLWIGNRKKSLIERDVYNRFTGTLRPLGRLVKLEELDISNTDINSDLEYLPESLKKIVYLKRGERNNKSRSNQLLANFDPYLKQLPHANYYDMIEWRKINFPYYSQVLDLREENETQKQKIAELENKLVVKREIEQTNTKVADYSHQQNLLKKGSVLSKQIHQQFFLTSTINAQKRKTKSVFILQWEGIELGEEANYCENFSVISGCEESNLLFHPNFFANSNYVSSFQKSKIYKLTYTGELEKDSSKLIRGIIGGNFAIEDVTDTQFIKEIWEEKEQVKKQIISLEKQLQAKKAENNLLRQQFTQVRKQNLSEQIKIKQKEIFQLEQQLNNLTFSDALQETEQRAQILQKEPYGIPGSSTSKI
ncbi:MAG: hypothetical protein MRECE_1c108 [Mycoplasmataceae bacterium CE_OT135]|nr:MAG: hypothetical protein MRECE_1c059 [Mycoplasmataceae bacterium CE_OT135]KLL04344.1 MAG: hypothetical protein MRECE_1c108 [Mycoplasmataceae bacterium CE_OT135]